MPATAPPAPPRWSRGRARSRPRRRRRCPARARAASPSARGRPRRPCAAHPRSCSAADRHDHELLEVDAVVGVRAAVQDVHHRHGQHVRAVAAEVAVERQALPRRRPPWRPRATRPGSRSRRGAPCWACRPARSARGRRPPGRRRRARSTACAISPFTCRDRLRHALAVPLLAAVAQLDRLELAGGRAGGHGRAAAARPTRATRRPRRSGCRASRGSGARARRRIALTARPPCAAARSRGRRALARHVDDREQQLADRLVQLVGAVVRSRPARCSRARASARERRRGLRVRRSGLARAACARRSARAASRRLAGAALAQLDRVPVLLHLGGGGRVRGQLRTAPARRRCAGGGGRASRASPWPPRRGRRRRAPPAAATRK